MPSPDGYAALLAAMAADLRDQPDEHSTAIRVLFHARHLVGCERAAVGLVRARGVIGTVGSSPEAEVLHSLQHEWGEGPAVDALATGELCVAGVGSGERWPRWESVARPVGVGGVVSASMTALGLAVGVIDFYLATPPAGEDQLARALGTHAAVALVTIRNETGLRTAIATRTVIGQAEGIVMERYGLDSNGAFQLLRRYSQHHNVKLRTVAEALVETGQLPAFDTGDELGRLTG
ncbi:MAG: GAF and ANTAR domain-containing protein [Jiangellaceae bacterium]|nr:GAF and ANTAR domain-containing protein [Jiangellaceae bacterium]